MRASMSARQSFSEEGGFAVFATFELLFVVFVAVTFFMVVITQGTFAISDNTKPPRPHSSLGLVELNSTP